MVTQSSNRVNIDRNNPCPHCGKPDWCYMYRAEDGNLLSVCNRDAEPAPGWEKSTKLDKQGKPIYYLTRIFWIGKYYNYTTPVNLYPA